MSKYESVFSAASQLSVPDRLRLIDELAGSVPDDQPPTLPEAWQDEIARRSSELDSGAVAAEPWSEIRERLFQKHGLHDTD